VRARTASGVGRTAPRAASRFTDRPESGFHGCLNQSCTSARTSASPRRLAAQAASRGHRTAASRRLTGAECQLLAQENAPQRRPPSAAGARRGGARQSCHCAELRSNPALLFQDRLFDRTQDDPLRSGHGDPWSSDWNPIVRSAPTAAGRKWRTAPTSNHARSRPATESAAGRSGKRVPGPAAAGLSGSLRLSGRHGVRQWRQSPSDKTAGTVRTTGVAMRRRRRQFGLDPRFYDARSGRGRCGRPTGDRAPIENVIRQGVFQERIRRQHSPEFQCDRNQRGAGANRQPRTPPVFVAASSSPAACGCLPERSDPPSSARCARPARPHASNAL